MGMTDQQFEVYNALISFVDDLIDRELDEKEREKLKQKKRIFSQTTKKKNKLLRCKVYELLRLCTFLIHDNIKLAERAFYCLI